MAAMEDAHVTSNYVVNTTVYTTLYTQAVSQNAAHLSLVRLSIQYINIIVKVFGISSNILNILVWKHKLFRYSSCSTYILNIAIWDMVFLVTSLPFMLYGTGLRNNYGFVVFIYYWIIPNSFVYTISSLASRYITVALTVERFIAIRFPAKSVVWCTPKRTRLCVTLLTLACLIQNVQALFYQKPVLYWNQYRNKYEVSVALTEYFKNNGTNAAFRWTRVVLRSVVPCVLLMISNILLIHALFVSRSRRQTLQEAQLPRGQQDVSAAQMVAILSSIFLCLTLFEAVNDSASAVLISFVHTKLWQLLRDIRDLLLNINAAMNFVIYVVYSKRFRDILCKVLHVNGNST